MSASSSALPPLDPRATFEGLLVEAREAVEGRLASAFAARLTARAPLGGEVRTVLEVARDFTLRGGKRFRAALVVAAFRGVRPDAPPEAAIAGGAALELLQSYLLVQDDWMDGDVERRGGPSAHVALAARLGLGEHAAAAAAMLGSDVLWGMAITELAGADVPATARAAALAELARVHEDVVFGQVLDTLAHADVETLHALKTGSYTVRGPLAVGALLAEADPATLAALDRYAAPLGVAFQLRDDLLGVFGTEAESGRPPGSDVRAGKQTSVIRHALEALGDRGAALRATLGRRDASADDVAAAVRTIETTDARARVEARLGALCAEAEAAARALPLTAEARAALEGASLAVRVGPGGRVAA